MKPVRTLILLADDQSARFLMHDGPGKKLREVAAISADAFQDTTIEYEDRPGRQTGGPSGAARHGFDPHETADEQGRDRFANHVVAALDKEWAKSGADQFVLAAPAKMLGVLRSRIKGEAARALHADFAKSLTGIPLQDLARHFEDVIRL